MRIQKQNTFMTFSDEGELLALKPSNRVLKKSTISILINECVILCNRSKTESPKIETNESVEKIL